MGTAEVQAEAEGLEITEMVDFEVDRIDGVPSPANGTGILLMKAIPTAAQTATPKPAACPGCGGTAVNGGKCTCAGMAAKETAPDAGWWVYPADAVIKDHREFSAADRKKNASAGSALPDGSYPVPDADALRRAAILARSKHGNWKAARRLIARRARELGVDNPLAGDDAGDGGKPKAKASVAAAKSVAEGGAPVDTGAQDGERITRLVSEQVAKALKPHEEREKSLEAELAKANAKIAEFAAIPIPGGPVMRAVPPADGTVKKTELLAKADEYDELARTVSDPERSANFAKLAAEKRAEAAKA